MFSKCSWLALALTFFTMHAAYAADCANNMPAPWNSAACDLGSGDICAWDGSTTIECFGTNEDDEIIVISLANDPIGFGYVAGGNAFCCDAAEMDDDTHDLFIEVYDDNDIVCLHDSNNGSCSNNIAGDQFYSYDSVIYGGDGNDFISTSKSAVTAVDWVDGGAGNDKIYTHAGDDKIYGGTGDDDIIAGADDDDIFGGDGADTIDGDAGVDQIDGDAGNDVIRGGDGNDELCGGGDSDDIYGMNDNDCICGGDNVTNDDGIGDVPLRGDSGTDTCYYYTGDTPLCETNNSSTTCSCTCPT